MNDANGEIYFGRLDDSANLIPNSIVPVTNASGTSAFPAIAWNGSNFAVVWHDMRSSPQGEVYFQLIDGTGVLLDSNGGDPGNVRRLTTDTAYSLYPNVAWTGSDWGVVWNSFSNGSNGYQIHFLKIASNGASVGTRQVVENTSGDSLFPDIVWNGSEYAVVWHDNRAGSNEIYFARLSDAGTKLEPEVAVTSNDGLGSEYATLAWNGTGYGVAWQDLRDGRWQIYFASLDRQGSVATGPVNVSESSSEALSPSLAWGAGQFGLSWRDDRFDTQSMNNFETLFTRLDWAGTVTDFTHRVTNGSPLSFWSTVVWNGLDFGLVWNEAVNDVESIQGTRIGCCEDADADGVNACAFNQETNPLGGDCADGNASTYPGAPEINDGIDSQCPGDSGYGTADELSGTSGFPNPADSSLFCWPLQSGATSYELVRSNSPLFSQPCEVVSTTGPCWSDADDPSPGSIFYYLVRPGTPNAGSWGLDSDGLERTNVCGTSVAWRIYVTDEGTDTVAVFDRQGGFLFSFPVADPRQIQVSPFDDRVYVAQVFAHRAMIFDRNGSLLGTLGNVTEPHGLAVGADGNIYLSGRVGRAYTPGGSFVRTFGTFGPFNGTALAANSSYLVAADNGNQSVHIMDADGDWIRTFPVGNYPRGVAIGPDGLVYVARDTANEIAVYDLMGTLIRTISGNGLSAPYGVAISPRGSLFVTNPGADNVLEFSLDGQLLSTLVHGFQLPNYIAFDQP